MGQTTVTPETRRAQYDAIASCNGLLNVEGPFLLHLDGQAWAVTTNGIMLIATRRDLVAGELAACPAKVETLAAKWIRGQQTTPVTTSVARLREFAGPPLQSCDTCKNQRTVKCDDCDGDGTQECECRCGDCHTATCEECEGDGSCKCPDCSGDDFAKPGDLLGAVVSREQLSILVTALCLCDEDRVDVSREPPGVHSLFVVRPHDQSQQWMALLMCMGSHVKPTAVFQQEVGV